MQFVNTKNKELKKIRKEKINEKERTGEEVLDFRFDGVCNAAFAIWTFVLF